MGEDGKKGVCSGGEAGLKFLIVEFGSIPKSSKGSLHFEERA
jgi:hypothetical protein